MQSSEAVHIEDVPVEEAWARLEKDPGSVLIDVRTRAEWTFVGLPDLGKIGKRVLTVEWQTSPDSKIDAGFSERLTAVLDAAGATKDLKSCFSSVGRVLEVAWQRKPWRAPGIGSAGMLRMASRGLSMPAVIEGRWPVGKLPACLGCKVRAPVSED